MNVIEEKSIDMLTVSSVSVLTKKFAETDEGIVQVGKNHRCGYDNSPLGRQTLMESEPESIVAEILAIWGDAPTVQEVNVEHAPEPTADERIAQLEENLALTELTMIEIYEAQEEINAQTENALIEIYERMEG